MWYFLQIFKTKHHLSVHNCKGPESLLEGDLKVPNNAEAVVTSSLGRIDSMDKVVVLYNTCEIEDSNNSSEDKCGVMLGSFSHGEDSESAILTRYSEDMED